MPSSDPLQHRFAVLADVPAVARLVERAYRGPESASGWTTEAHLLESPRSDPEEIGRLVADPDSRFLLGESRDGRLVACALLQRAGEDAYFGMFAVQPSHQGGGVGSGMLRAAETAARELWGARAMTMSVISVRAELIAWYQRRGYALTGTRQPFPFGEFPALRTDFDLVQLRKPLV